MLAQAEKTIGNGCNPLILFLRQIKWMTRCNELYQNKMNAEYLDVKLSSWQHSCRSLQQSVTALVTGKEWLKLQKLWSTHNEIAV